MKSGIKRIAEERKRQISKEGYSIDHDDEHWKGELLQAAAAYVGCAAGNRTYFQVNHRGGSTCVFRFYDPWPWDDNYDKRPLDSDGTLRTPSDKEAIRLLEKAGALIAAEIDRLLRKESTHP